MSEEQSGGMEATPLAPPPPLIELDQPNPPNVVISQSSALPTAYHQHTGHSGHSGNAHSDHTHSGHAHSDPSGFMLSTRQIITASRLCPDLEVTSCANDEDVDLDKMYMEAMMEDLKYSVGR